MNIRLAHDAYGKNAINLSKVIRHPDRHEIRQISVNISLQGDFETVHTLGDNRKVLPTDTMKNTVYILARDHFSGSIEVFGMHLTEHFLTHNPQVSEVMASLTEYCWSRMSFEGAPHPHAFLNGGSEKHTARITGNRTGLTVEAGIKDLLILKTTDSGFENYIRDPYTTLKATSDRIFATQCEASWIYSSPPRDPEAGDAYAGIRLNLLKTFAEHKSLSVQHTLYAMGENILKDFPAVKEITLRMPNKHHIPFNMEPFGIENGNEIFMATDEPYGLITGTVVRD
ncbi:MAG TPA: urate oxidase [Puia sp.]|nr:urate oxidase [Puia sp.]